MQSGLPSLCFAIVFMGNGRAVTRTVFHRETPALPRVPARRAVPAQAVAGSRWVLPASKHRRPSGGTTPGEAGPAPLDRRGRPR
jgi:hypothetical protein